MRGRSREVKARQAKGCRVAEAGHAEGGLRENKTRQIRDSQRKRYFSIHTNKTQ